MLLLSLRRLVCLLLCSLVFWQTSLAQKHQTFVPSDTLNKIRLSTVEILGSTAYAGSIYGMYSLWYSDFGPEPFHYFNDNDEWMLMDKAGHVYSAFTLSSRGIRVMKWTGLEKNKSILIGTLYGYLFQTSIEVFDGFSPEWGFSWGDILANSIGSGFAAFQEYQYGEQRISLKWSYRKTEFPNFRPNLLGESSTERVFKDYNGQSYWISVPLRVFGNPSGRIPKWLCVSIGYGAEGMMGARGNPDVNEQGDILPHYERRSQFFLSMDIDLTKIPTKSPLLKTIFNVLNIIKVPFPSIEYNKTDQFTFHPLYF